MAVHEPYARVVSLEGHDEVTARRQCGGIATNGVVKLEARRITGPSSILGPVKDEEIVTVKMDGVWYSGSRRSVVLLYYPVRPLADVT
jgi:hypothetical protein